MPKNEELKMTNEIKLDFQRQQSFEINENTNKQSFMGEQNKEKTEKNTTSLKNKSGVPEVNSSELDLSGNKMKSSNFEEKNVILGQNSAVSSLTQNVKSKTEKILNDKKVEVYVPDELKMVNNGEVTLSKTQNVVKRQDIVREEVKDEIKEEVKNVAVKEAQDEEEKINPVEEGRKKLNSVIKRNASFKNLVSDVKAIFTDKYSKDSQSYAELRRSAGAFLNKLESDELANRVFITIDAKKLSSKLMAIVVLRQMTPEIEALQSAASIYAEEHKGRRFTTKGRSRRDNNKSLLDCLKKINDLANQEADLEWNSTFEFIESLSKEDAMDRMSEEALKIDATIVRLGGVMDEKGNIEDYPVLSQEVIEEIINKENPDVYELLAIYLSLNHYSDIYSMASNFTAKGEEKMEDYNLGEKEKEKAKELAQDETTYTYMGEYYRITKEKMFENLMAKDYAPDIYKLLYAYVIDKKKKANDFIVKTAKELNIPTDKSITKVQKQQMSAIFSTSKEGRQFNELEDVMRDSLDERRYVFLHFNDALLSKKLYDVDNQTAIGELHGNLKKIDILYRDLINGISKTSDEMTKFIKDKGVEYFKSIHEELERKKLRVPKDMKEAEERKIVKWYQNEGRDKHYKIKDIVEAQRKQLKSLEETDSDLSYSKVYETPEEFLEKHFKETKELMYDGVIEAYLQNTFGMELGNYYQRMAITMRYSIAYIRYNINNANKRADKEYQKCLQDSEKLFLALRKILQDYKQKDKNVPFRNNSKIIINKYMRQLEQYVLYVQNELSEIEEKGLLNDDLREENYVLYSEGVRAKEDRAAKLKYLGDGHGDYD